MAIYGYMNIKAAKSISYPNTWKVIEFPPLDKKLCKAHCEYLYENTVYCTIIVSMPSEGRLSVIGDHDKHIIYAQRNVYEHL